MATKRGRSQDRKKLSSQKWELEHVAEKLGVRIGVARLARKRVMERAAAAAGQNRKLVEAEIRKLGLSKGD